MVVEGPAAVVVPVVAAVAVAAESTIHAAEALHAATAEAHTAVLAKRNEVHVAAAGRIDMPAAGSGIPSGLSVVAAPAVACAIREEGSVCAVIEVNSSR